MIPWEIRRAVLDLRAKKHMLVGIGAPSAGSFFRNPILRSDRYRAVSRRWFRAGGTPDVPFREVPGGRKVPAAWLIERSGYPRGAQVGRVGVSSRHALSLVNHSGTATELLYLAGEIQAAVTETFGVRLETEPDMIRSPGSPADHPSTRFPRRDMEMRTPSFSGMARRSSRVGRRDRQ